MAKGATDATAGGVPPVPVDLTPEVAAVVPAEETRALSKLARSLVFTNYSGFIATVTTLITVVYFYLSLTSMRHAMESTLFNTVHSEYSSARMLDSFAELENFLHDAGGDHYAEQFLKETTARTEFGRELEHARRHVQSWFAKVAYFHEFELLDDRYLRVFPGPRRTGHFLRLVEPLALAAAAQRNDTVPGVFNYFRKFYRLPPLEELEQLYAHDEL